MSKTKSALTYLLIILVIFASIRISLFSLRFTLGSDYPLVVVSGHSMEKTFFDGDLLAVKGVADTNSINLNDIIVFHDPFDYSLLIVHRVYQIIQNSSLEMFVTKGDNNPGPDPWVVQETDIVGVVVARVPSAGLVFMFIQSPEVTVLLIVLLIIEYVGYSQYEKRKKKEDLGKTTL